MKFEIQRFADIGGGAYSSGEWIELSDGSGFVYVPEGNQYPNTPDGKYDARAISGATFYSATITGVSNVTGTEAEPVITLASGKTVDDVTVSGVNVKNVSVSGGDTYTVSEGKLATAGAIVSTSIQLKTKQPNGKVVSKAFSHINPDATDADLQTAMVAMANLSDNTLVEIERVSRKSLL